jgi:hypothetical protein
MSRIARIDIDRLSIAVHGVAAPVVEAAVAGLVEELRRRLGALRGSWQAASVPALSLHPLDLPPHADAAALRALLAERLLAALLRPEGPSEAA